MKHDLRLARGLLKVATSEIIFKNYELIDENSKESLMQAKQEIASTNFNSDIYKEFLERRKLK